MMPKINSKIKILVGLSGGVDSSVAGALLKEKGFHVEGAYMRCWSEGAYCTSDQDQADAARVASILNIPFHVLDFEKEYKESVIEYFFSEYEKGRTPNPDVMCNKEIKFGIFLKKALEMGFDFIATGHYARISNGHGHSLLKGSDETKYQTLEYQLLAGSDREKDQSYFLYPVGQKELAHTIFPVGGLKKNEVRELARKFGLPTADKLDSTGICFVGPTQLKEFLLQRIKIRHGDIVTKDGKVLGKHIGLPFYTIGQREGLGISAKVPHYVMDKDLEKNRLIIAPFGDDSLYKEKFLGSYAHWVGYPPEFPAEVEVKLRYRAKSIPARIEKTTQGLEVTLVEKERAVTPGQSAVFYQGEKVLGGAVIEQVIN